MKDRISVSPGRVLITPESGAPFYATMARADNPAQEGDPLSKNTLLKDSTAEALGLSDEALPDDALRILSRFHTGMGNEYLWSKIANYNTIVTGTSVSDYMLVSDSQTSATVQYAGEVTLSGNEIVLINPATLAISLNNLGASTVLNNKYVKLVSTVASAAVIYCTYASGVDYYIQGKSVSVGIDGNVVGYVNSPNPNAYPPAEDDGFTYTALGMLGEKVRIATGSYTGDGRGGSTSSQWCSLTFPFVPKFVMIWANAGTVSFTFYGYGDANFYSITPGSDNYPRQNVVTVSGETMTWWTQQTSGLGLANNQLNVSGRVYRYLAIG